MKQIPLFLCIVMLFALPLAVRADIFLTPNTSGEQERLERPAEDEQRPRTLFVPRERQTTQNQRSSRQSYRPHGFVNLNVYRDAYKVETGALGMAGPAPRTQEELRLVAAKHRTASIVSMLEQRRTNLAQLNTQKERWAMKVQASQERSLLTSQPKRSEVNAVKAQEYRPMNEALQKPQRVFQNIR